MVSGWSTGGEGLEPAEGGGGLGGPGPPGGEAEPQASAAADDAPGSGEQSQAETFGFPPAGGAGEGDHLHPGEQVAGQSDDLAPDLVLGIAPEREVAQAGVF